MTDPRDEEAEEKLLRSVALQNAQSILLARQRAEEELVRAKDTLERRTGELAHSLAMMRATLESTTDGILVTDGGGTVTGFNQNFVDMWRLPPEVLDAKKHQRLLEANSRQFADPEGFLATVGAIYASSPPESYDLLELADGRVIERFSRIQFVEERNVGRVWSFRDITDRKRTEETSRFLADATATLVELTDYDRTLQRIASLAVPAFADWCAVDMQEADGSIRRLAVTHADPSKVDLARELFRRHPPQRSNSFGVGKVLRSGESDWMATIPPGFIESALPDSGSAKMLRELGLQSYICAPLRSRSGTLGVLTFVTAESGRIYHAADVAAAEDLAHRAVIAIENANLLAALKESDRRKDEFLAMLAHELRNPLAPIRNAVQIMRATGPPVPQLQWATEVIERQAQQMTRLVDDLLDVSRIAGGKLQLHKERIDLTAVVSSAVEASRPLIDKGRHEFTVTMPSPPSARSRERSTWKET